MLRILALVCALVLFGSCSSSNGNQMLTDGGINLGTGTAFGNSWNIHCESCNFDSNVNVSTLTTLGNLYNGSDFGKDIGLMDEMITDDLGEASGLEGASSQALYIYFDDEGIE